MTTWQADIVIVGSGIAGPALAAALRHSNLRILLIERSADPLDTARGDHLQPSTAEILDQWGLLAHFLKAGAMKRLGSHWLTADGDTLLHARVDDLAIPHPYYLYLNHETICEVLLTAANENSQFTCLKPAKLTQILAHTGEGPSKLEVLKEGESHHIEAHMIVGADGRASTIRRLYDMPADIYAYENPLVVLFAPVSENDPRHDLHAYLTEKGVVSFVPRMPDHWKIGFPITSSDLVRWKNSSVMERSAWLTAMVPHMAPLDTAIAGFYQPVKITTPQWVKENVVLLGDACHALHPGQSQGMNIAIRCVDRLISCLPSEKDFDVLHVQQALRDYERAVKPQIDPLLQANHERGLEMDSLTSQEVLARIPALREVGQDETKRHAYCLRMAGYPPQTP